MEEELELRLALLGGEVLAVAFVGVEVVEAGRVVVVVVFVFFAWVVGVILARDVEGEGGVGSWLGAFVVVVVVVVFLVVLLARFAVGELKGALLRAGVGSREEVFAECGCGSWCSSTSIDDEEEIFFLGANDCDFDDVDVDVVVNGVVDEATAFLFLGGSLDSSDAPSFSSSSSFFFLNDFVEDGKISLLLLFPLFDDDADAAGVDNDDDDDLSPRPPSSSAGITLFLLDFDDDNDDDDNDDTTTFFFFDDGEDSPDSTFNPLAFFGDNVDTSSTDVNDDGDDKDFNSTSLPPSSGFWK